MLLYYKKSMVILQYLHKYLQSLLFSFVFAPEFFPPLFISLTTGGTIPIAIILFVLSSYFSSTFRTLRRASLLFIPFSLLFLPVTSCAEGNGATLRLLWKCLWYWHHGWETRYDRYQWSCLWYIGSGVSNACLTDRGS